MTVDGNQSVGSPSDAVFIKALVERKYPSDYSMQAYEYGIQLPAYRKMRAFPHNNIRALEEQKYPDDYSMQAYEYTIQFPAYNYMMGLQSDVVKAMVERQYPDDYSMQEYEYKIQSAGKKRMDSN